MVDGKIIITEETNISEILKFLNINLDDFYYDFIADNINRADFWRSWKNSRIEITKK